MQSTRTGVRMTLRPTAKRAAAGRRAVQRLRGQRRRRRGVRGRLAVPRVELLRELPPERGRPLRSLRVSSQRGRPLRGRRVSLALLLLEVPLLPPRLVTPPLLALLPLLLLPPGRNRSAQPGGSKGSAGTQHTSYARCGGA
jgi:hypothetical protein